MENLRQKRNKDRKIGKDKILHIRRCKMKRFFGIAALALPLALQAAVTVKVSPNPAVVKPKEAVQFKADVTDSSENLITDAKIKWDVKPEFLGKIGPDGLFLASNKEGKGIVRALVETKMGRGIGHALLVVGRENQEHGLKVKVIPPRTFAKIGEPIQFKAEVFDNDGKPVEGAKLVWKVAPPHVGTITQDGLFTGAEFGKGKIIVLAKLGELEGAGNAIVMVGEPGKYLPVQIRPLHVVMKPGETQQFKFEILGPRDDSMPVKTEWKVVPEGLGTITNDGIFTANKEKGKGFVGVIVKIGNMTGGDRASVIIGKPEKLRVKIYPKFAVVEPMGTIQFHAEVFDGNGDVVQTPIKWEVKPNKFGTINSEGLFTADGEVGKCEVLAIVPQEFGVGLDRAGVVIGKDMPLLVRIEPRSPRLKPGETIRFKAVVTDRNGKPQDVPIAWEVRNNIGTITKEGLFTARNTPGNGGVAAIIPPKFGQGKDMTEVQVVGEGPMYNVKIEPKTVQVKVGTSLQFHARAFDKDGKEVQVPLVWRVESFAGPVGNVSSNGLFTAGPKSADCRVIVDVKPENGGGHDFADVKIVP